MWHIIRRRNGPHGKRKNTYVVSITYDPEEVESEFFDWFELSCDRVQ